MDDCEYIFVYKDAHGKLNTATNISFVAQHKTCVAIRKYLIRDINISDLLHELNYEVPSKDTLKLVADTDLHLIY